jgi:hypothetical protein
VRRESPLLFSHLASAGRFHRDSVLGRVFHPGTVSYREVSATDSLHLAVTADNHVSVHVDRVSPLAMRAGRPSRYSVTRTLAHNAVAGWEWATRTLRGEHGHQACHLACEIVWVPDDEPIPDGDDVTAEAVGP